MVLIIVYIEFEYVILECELGWFKCQIDQCWVELVYDGLWYLLLKVVLEVFVVKIQEYVFGEVWLVLYGGYIVVNGWCSVELLYDFNLVIYDEGDSFDQFVVCGFVYVYGLFFKFVVCWDLW